jgi:hypothetical protein
MAVTREVAWGDALLTKVARHPGGLNACVGAIRDELGSIVGVRNTFAKLLHTQDPSDLKDSDTFRAWLLLTVLEEDPADWGIDAEEAVPAGYDRDRLVRQLPRLVAGAGFEPATSGLCAWVWTDATDRSEWGLAA